MGDELCHDGVCAGELPPLLGGRLTGVGLTLDEAVARLEAGEDVPLTAVQRRLVEAHALRGV